MNHLKHLGLAALAVVSLFFSECGSSESGNGWYYVTDSQTMKLSNTPFMTLEDIKDVCMEKDGMGNEVIKLELKKEGIKKFEKATDAHKGEYIAFLCNNYVISEVLVHEKISSAYLLITVPDKELLQHTYETLKSSIK